MRQSTKKRATPRKGDATGERGASTVLARALEILRYVAKQDKSVSVPELIEALRIPRPTAHRICRTLEGMQLLARDLNPKRVTVGPHFASLALAALSANARLAPHRAILRQVVEETDETCTLTVLEFDEVVFLDRVESASPLRLQLYAGSRVPVHCTSAGKLFLALMPPARRASLIRARPLKRYTEATITDPDRLERELEEIRAERVSRDNQEFIQGLVAIAVPVVDARGRMIASVSVNGPAARIDLQKKERHVHALRRAATGLSRLLDR